MKKAITISFILIFTCLLVTLSFASTTAKTTETSSELISNETKSQLIEIKENEIKSIEDYNEAYGGAPYGLVAYIINKVRIFSIPLAVLGIAICSIYEYVIGHRHIENRQKGFNGMITVVTLLVICQVLPLVYAIVIKGWRG